MKNWQDFLDSLSTKGGNIIVATFIMVLLGIGVEHSLHHSADNSTIRDLLISTFSGFAGALLAMLKGDSSRQQMVDRRDSVLPGAPATVKESAEAGK